MITFSFKDSSYLLLKDTFFYHVELESGSDFNGNKNDYSNTGNYDPNPKKCHPS